MSQKRNLTALLSLALALPARAGVVFSDSFSLPNGLITNDFASYHPTEPGAKHSATWFANSGSLFAINGSAWTGKPDVVVSNAGSTNGSGSAIFRLYTKRTDFKDVTVRFRLYNQGLMSTTRTPAQPYDGVHVWLRYADETRLYALTVNRRDGLVVLKKKVPGGPSNGGSYYNVSAEVPLPTPYRTWQSIAASAQNNADGSVTLRLWINGVLRASGVDRGLGGVAAYTGPGRVGIRGDNCDFLFDDFSVDAMTPTAPPVIAGVQASGVTGTGAVITWSTNQSARSWVEYGPTASYGTSTPMAANASTSHRVTLSGLRPGTVYHYRVKSRNDVTGQIGVSGDFTFTTPVSVLNTNVLAMNVTSSSALISWKTNVVTHSQVEYGPTAAYGSRSPRSSATGLYHGMTLSGLAPGTVYHYRVRSLVPGGGAEGISGDFIFKTAPAPAAMRIFNVKASNVGPTSAHIGWTTDVVSNSQVEYGRTTAYGSQTAVSSASGLYHGVQLSGLVPGTVYHYRVKSRDASGRLGVSGDFLFTTPSGTSSAAR